MLLFIRITDSRKCNIRMTARKKKRGTAWTKKNDIEIVYKIR